MSHLGQCYMNVMPSCYVVSRVLPSCYVPSRCIAMGASFEIYCSKYVNGQTDFRKTVFCEMIFFKV